MWGVLGPPEKTLMGTIKRVTAVFQPGSFSVLSDLTLSALRENSDLATSTIQRSTVLWAFVFGPKKIHWGTDVPMATRDSHIINIQLLA